MIEDNIKLDELIPEYFANKTELSEYKKICDKQGETIKKLMLELGMDEYTIGNITAKRIVANRESFNEESLMALLKSSVSDTTAFIKTKEYIDMDALEKAIYNGDISKDVLLSMESCKVIMPVVTLRVTEGK